MRLVSASALVGAAANLVASAETVDAKIVDEHDPIDQSEPQRVLGRKTVAEQGQLALRMPR